MQLLIKRSKLRNHKFLRNQSSKQRFSSSKTYKTLNCSKRYLRRKDIYYIFREYWTKTYLYMESRNNLILRIQSLGYLKEFLSNKLITTTNRTNTVCRFSINLYTASSVILALCYFTTSTFAASDMHPIFDESSSDKEILDRLLQPMRYDKRLLPPVNAAKYGRYTSNPTGKEKRSGTLDVNVNVLLLSLASPDESSLKYEVEFLLNQQWSDPRLEYGNRSQYDYLNALHHHNDVWLPDTYFIMHGDFKDPLIPMHFALRIYRNGTITYAMRRHLILSCQGSLHIFPFDDPKCSFAMESISHESNQIKYTWKNDQATLRKSPSLTTLNAYLVDNSTLNCPIKSWRGNYSCLRVDLTFTRDRAFYFTTVFIPGIILVTSSFITFWLEWNAVPARVMIGVTTMLNFFTTSNGFRSTLPVVSNLTAMNVWDGVCMCFIYASLLEFVCVNYVGRKRPLHNVVYRPGENPVTQRLPAVLSRIGVILASPLEVIEKEFMTAMQSEKGQNISGPSSRTAQTSSPLDEGKTTTEILLEKNLTENVNVIEKLQEMQASAAVAATAVTFISGHEDAEMEECPVKPPRRRSVNRRPRSIEIQDNMLSDDRFTSIIQVDSPNSGEKKRDGVPNEIVACTSCGGGTSPCTHTANNGCATETCFVQVRKKEPPHPIRVAKTIDVIARITFPTAYAIFLIFFFVHYKGFS